MTTAKPYIQCRSKVKAGVMTNYATDITTFCARPYGDRNVVGVVSFTFTNKTCACEFQSGTKFFGFLESMAGYGYTLHEVILTNDTRARSPGLYEYTFSAWEGSERCVCMNYVGNDTYYYAGNVREARLRLTGIYYPELTTMQPQETVIGCLYSNVSYESSTLTSDKQYYVTRLGLD